jgi:hypothetical protein
MILNELSTEIFLSIFSLHYEERVNFTVNYAPSSPDIACPSLSNIP